jgi:hypothetical protein
MIGTAADGVSALGNTGEGIAIMSLAHHNTIGGTAEAAGNVIASNGREGVLVGTGCIANRINANSIYGNGRLGINLAGGVEDSRGVTNNDLGDGDTGANNLQNFPIVGTVIGGSSLYLEGILSSTANAAFRVEFFVSPAVNPPLYGEGRTYLGWIDVNTDATGTASFAPTIGTPVAAGQSITATATDGDGNTSECGIPITVTYVEGWEVVTNTDDSGPGSLRQAIVNANAKAANDTIAFNIPGTEVHQIRPTTPLPSISAPVVIDGYTQPGSRGNTRQFSDGNNAVLKIEIDGSAAGTTNPGLQIRGRNTVVRGLIVNRFETTPAIQLSEISGCRVEGCFIGTDSSGTVRLGNFVGVDVQGSNNTVGGLDAADRNVISGNTNRGVSIGDGAWGNFVLGNYIGLDATGRAPLGNAGVGVLVEGGWSNRIGGTIPGSSNAIVGDSSRKREHWCIAIKGENARGNVLAGNFIGTNAAGDDSVANASGGVLIGANRNTVGGTSTASRNVISGNFFGGILIASDSNYVRGNYIGVDVTGTKPLGNRGVGVLVAGRSNLVGGRTSAAGNVISGNSGPGVVLQSRDVLECRGNWVQGNRIGTQADGASPLGNQGSGVEIAMDCMEAVIGDTVEGAGNTIAFNGEDGIRVANDAPDLGADPDRNRFSGNSIFANAGLGINIAGGAEDSFGVTANDPGDPDTGPNALQNYPVLTSAEGGGSLAIRGTLNSTPSSQFILEFFATPIVGAPGHGEGENFLGRTAVQSDVSGDVSFHVNFAVPVVAGRSITATATNQLGNTSEFSASINVIATDVTLNSETPAAEVLFQNYPNPFNPSTVIRYGLPSRSHATLTVFSTLGQQVMVMQDGEQEAGYHEVRFDRSGLVSGVYFYRLRAGNFVQTKRLLLLR